MKANFFSQKLWILIIWNLKLSSNSDERWVYYVPFLIIWNELFYLMDTSVNKNMFTTPYYWGIYLFIKTIYTLDTLYTGIRIYNPSLWSTVPSWVLLSHDEDSCSIMGSTVLLWGLLSYDEVTIHMIHLPIYFTNSDPLIHIKNT